MALVAAHRQTLDVLHSRQRERDVLANRVSDLLGTQARLSRQLAELSWWQPARRVRLGAQHREGERKLPGMQAAGPSWTARSASCGVPPGSRPGSWRGHRRAAEERLARQRSRWQEPTRPQPARLSEVHLGRYGAARSEPSDPSAAEVYQQVAPPARLVPKGLSKWLPHRSGPVVSDGGRRRRRCRQRAARAPLADLAWTVGTGWCRDVLTGTCRRCNGDRPARRVTYGAPSVRFGAHAGALHRQEFPTARRGAMVLLTIEEAAVLLGTSPRFIRRLVAERRIAYTKVGKFVRIASADLDGFVAAGRVEADTGGQGARPDGPIGRKATSDDVPQEPPQLPRLDMTDLLLPTGDLSDSDRPAGECPAGEQRELVLRH